MIDKGEDNIVTRFFKPQVPKKIEKPEDLKEKKRAAAVPDETQYRDWETDRKSTRLNSSHRSLSRMPSSA